MNQADVWSEYARPDRDFLERLMAAGIEIGTIWDVGASNGAWSSKATAHFPEVRVELFEPIVPFDEAYGELMRWQLAQNPRWRLHATALGAQEGEASIYIPEKAHGSSLIASDYVKTHWRAVTVPVKTMDGLIARGGLPVPDVLKTDVQGYELEVLKGGERQLGKVKALILEAWLSRGYGPQTPLLEEIMAWLTPRGFVVAEINGGYRDKAGHMRSVDAFFVHQDITERLGIRR
jgi:FkbM family methyltransferase